MPFHVTILYAGLNALVLLVLAMRVARLRKSSGVTLGASGNSEVERGMRAHGNAAEYIPIVLILMGLLEAYRVPTLVLHPLGIAFTIGRVLHAWGMWQSSGPSPGRNLGIAITWVVLLIAAVLAVAIGLGARELSPS